MLKHTFALTLLSLLLQSCSNEGSVNSQQTNLVHKQNFQQLFDDAIYCAALIALEEQIEHGKISTNGKPFKWIGLTLGQANNYKVDGKLTASTEEQYRSQALALFLQHKQTKTTLDQQAHDDCVEQAQIYDPETQMETLLKKAKKMSLQKS